MDFMIFLYALAASLIVGEIIALIAERLDR